VSCFVCHDLPNEHSMALTRPVQCLHAALILPCASHSHSHSLQLSFLFLPRRRNVAQLRFPQTVNLPPQSRTFRPFRLRRHAFRISKKTPEQRHDPGPCRHQIDSLAFIIPFSSPSFVFSPARHPLRLRALLTHRHRPPCFNCCFRVSASTLVTLFLFLWL
jgi:hypothetical protein